MLLAEGSQVVTIDDYWLTFLIGTLLPVLTALVTKRFAPGWWKGLTLLVLSVLAGWLTSLQATGGEFEVKAAVSSIFISFVTAVSLHLGLLKQLNITGKDGVVARTVSAGLGPVQAVTDIVDSAGGKHAATES